MQAVYEIEMVRSIALCQRYCYSAAMKKTSFAGMNCPVAQALDQIGEWWSLLILRNAFNGVRTFDQFQKTLGIASNILAGRLQVLVNAGILERARDPHDGRRFEYRLTDKGRALHPVLVGLYQWGEEWVPNEKGRRVELIDDNTGEPIAPLQVTSKDGRKLRPQEVRVEPGPGADQHILVTLAAGRQRRSETDSAKQPVSDS